MPKIFKKAAMNSCKALVLVMAHVNVYLCNPHQASESYPLSSIDASINADVEADPWCCQALIDLKFVQCFKFVICT